MFIACFFWESDIWIETTFMCYGNVPNEIISRTLKPEIMKRWAYNADTCSRIVEDIANMSDHSGDRKVTSHEKEKPSRTTSDAKDRDKIRKRLTWIVPLDPYSHPADLDHVATAVWFHLNWWTHMTQWILGMDNLCHLKRAGLMDLLFYPSCY